jgi:hypothetical protein
MGNADTLGRTVMRTALVIFALTATAHAQMTDPPPRDNVQWLIEFVHDRGWFGAKGVDPDGRHIGISWKRVPERTQGVLVLRRALPPGTELAARPIRAIDHPGPLLIPHFLWPSDLATYHPAFDARSNPIPPGSKVGEWTVVAYADGDPDDPIIDEVAPGVHYVYTLIPATRGPQSDTYSQFGDAILTDSVTAEPAWFLRRRWLHLALIAGIAAALFGFTRLAKKRKLFVRRPPAVDAIETAIGRSVELGRPVLYVTGVYETQDIQTIASLLVLGHVAKITAERGADLRVANAYPLTMVIAEEVVRQAYTAAGKADAHRPDHILFITSEQFAFAAGVNGIMVREKPAANIFLGKFFAESLMLAETGYLTGAVQIAGTAELTQLPFFVSACDYTLIGEELFAASAFLANEPNQIALIKAGDTMKVAIVVLVVGFTVCATLGAAGYYPFSRFSIADVLP